MSGPVVTIGYLVLIPCVIGIIIGVVSILGTFSTDNSDFKLDRDYSAKTEDLGIDPNLADKAKGASGLTDKEKATLTDDQYAGLSQAVATMNNSEAVEGIAKGAGVIFGIVMTIGSFIFGLLGWLLIMKKRVLQCQSCQATVSAS